jgi:hypothetical protein
MDDDIALDRNVSCLEEVRAAFSHLRPVRDDYPMAPIQDGFNWDECAARVAMPPLYLVVFRSVRRADADVDLLRTFDDRAYEDACRAPGFLYYFKGQVTPERACLSFCLWESRSLARAASGRTAHRDAAGIATAMYDSYRLERYQLLEQHGKLVFNRFPD